MIKARVYQENKPKNLVELRARIEEECARVTLGEVKHAVSHISYCLQLVIEERGAVTPFRCLAAMHEGWDTARSPRPRQGKSRGRGRIRTTDLPASKFALLTTWAISPPVKMFTDNLPKREQPRHQLIDDGS
ncbi:hypothetical protein T265_05668 [Opisthorchis viverrini]|uniref:Uncharacterized protein n=1 Tax=Opisthorchis viverrini TaxID=6198 RepID=A0A075AF12_OPIVI|nr:hypothetical protein T265_05668 [Opisthorchis viverrini]KER27264.1 hypothetical protein T265_05668 [Opisthorchis viverrini]